MSMPRDDDAQRDMEQRALRNVRALVDKYEDSDARDSRFTRRVLTWAIAFAAVAAIAVLAYLQFAKPKDPPKTLVLPPPGQAPR